MTAPGEHLPGCPVLTDPRAAGLDCRCWPWADDQLAQLDNYDPAPATHVVDWHDQDRCWACACGFTSRAQHNVRRHADAANAIQAQGGGW